MDFLLLCPLLSITYFLFLSKHFLFLKVVGGTLSQAVRSHFAKVSLWSTSTGTVYYSQVVARLV